MNSRDYWAQREAEALKHYVTDEAEYQRQLQQIYQNMLDACQKEIDSFYGKYAMAEGISIAEAKKRVSQHDVKAFERKAAKYVKEKNFSKKANEELRLYNATMRINRLEMLKANIGLETIAGHDELEKFMAGILKGRTEDELKRQAGILGKTIRNNAAKANAIVNGSFHNGTFSDRIWQYQDLMRQDLGKLLQQGLIQGKGARAIAKDLKKYWYGNDPRTGGGATYCMERLMRTELARVQTEAQKQSFIRNGFDHYEFIVNGGCCPICQGLSGKHFLVEKMMPGENAPPMHPNCRCSTAAWEDDEEYEAWLDYLDKGGTTEEWNKLKGNYQLKMPGERGEKAIPLSERGIEIDPRLKKYLEQLVSDGDYISDVAGTFTAEDLSLLTREAGVEFTVLTIKDRSYLIRGADAQTTIPNELTKMLHKHKGTLDYHSHPFIGNLWPSPQDEAYLRALTWQEESVIIDPEQGAGKFTAFGSKETFALGKERDDAYWADIFGEGD